MHNRMLNLNNDKMSKSLGNILLVKDVLKQYDANTFRLALLQTHYRSIINFTDELMENSIKINDKIFNVYKKLSLYKQLNNNAVSKGSMECLSYLENDFNTSNLITYVLDLTKKINSAERNKLNILDFYPDFIDAIYLLGLYYEYPTLTEDEKQMYVEWENARANKDFDLADKLRDQLESRGII